MLLPMTRTLSQGIVCASAQVYAQNAIRKKSEALNYLRLASRLDAVSSRLDTQVKMNQVRRGGCRYTVAMRPTTCGHTAARRSSFCPRFRSGLSLSATSDAAAAKWRLKTSVIHSDRGRASSSLAEHLTVAKINSHAAAPARRSMPAWWAS
jgi:hypothetical protein